MKARFRFIAGAVCPKCGTLDVIRLHVQHESGLERLDCVACDYQDIAAQPAVNYFGRGSRVQPDRSPDSAAEAKIKPLKWV
jgi:uncharacterized metal-binding protein (TIGR02443 family)